MYPSFASNSTYPLREHHFLVRRQRFALRRKLGGRQHSVLAPGGSDGRKIGRNRGEFRGQSKLRGAEARGTRGRFLSNCVGRVFLRAGERGGRHAGRVATPEATYV